MQESNSSEKDELRLEEIPNFESIEGLDAQTTSESKFVIELIKTLYRLVKKSGVVATVDSLREAEHINEPSREDIDYIINTVCEVTKIRRKFLTSKKHRKETARARQYVALFLTKYSELSDTRAGQYIGRSRQTVWHIEMEYQKRVKLNKINDKFLKTYKIIDDKLYSQFVKISDVEDKI